MRIRPRLLARAVGVALGFYLAGSLVAPRISADSYGQRLRASLGRALGRKVEIRGRVRFSLWRGPGFSAEDVVVAEDPSIGLEPAAYMDTVVVRPALWPLLFGRFVVGSIRLEDATLNLAKMGDRWNFNSFLNRSVMSTAPAIQVRDGRINFKFGDTKSVFYLMNADLDISPPRSRRGGWKVSGEADAARTDEPALGLGSFALNGKWYIEPERVDMELRLDRAQLSELAVLMSAPSGVHGLVTSRLRLAGPLNGIGIMGRLTIEDVHRWDLLPPKGQGWPMDIQGRLDLVAQRLELQSTSSVVPLTARFRASDYLSRPRWAATFTWNRFPIRPVLQLAADMGVRLPARLRIDGSIDGAIGYSNPGGLQGELVLHNTSLDMPDSQPLRLDQVHVMAGGGKLWLAPSVVRTAGGELARVEALYSMSEDALDLSISSENMQVTTLRTQAGLTGVPWLEQLSSGSWSGQLRYHREPANPDATRWTGNLLLSDAEANVPGLSHPLEIRSARVGIDGRRVALDHLVARTGAISFSGEYRYEPGAHRPHRIRLRAETLAAADLEAELLPTLHPGASLLARALGRGGTPEWLRQRHVEGTVQIGDFEADAIHLKNLRARVVWDAARVNVAAFDARLDRATIEGTLAGSLSPRAPSYELTAKVTGLAWQGARMDAEGTLRTSGIGPQLLANLRLIDLSLRTDDGVYVGRGATQDDGRLLIVLTNGAKQMRMSGSLAALKLDEAAEPRP
ncbi:MAG TPA: hypothetical protein VKV17_18545 [Bryobacteraceae bacterium]|nr:hypothetical protein [Bryobacteraceae bacterium]